MTHTFDSEVSLHYWFLWPTVVRALRKLWYANAYSALTEEE